MIVFLLNSENWVNFDLGSMFKFTLKFTFKFTLTFMYTFLLEGITFKLGSWNSVCYLPRPRPSTLARVAPVMPWDGARCQNV